MEQLTDTVKNVSDHPEEKKICCEAGQKNIFSKSNGGKLWENIQKDFGAEYGLKYDSLLWIDFYGQESFMAG